MMPVMAFPSSMQLYRVTFYIILFILCVDLEGGGGRGSGGGPDPLLENKNLLNFHIKIIAPQQHNYPSDPQHPGINFWISACIICFKKKLVNS